MLLAYWCVIFLAYKQLGEERQTYSPLGELELDSDAGDQEYGLDSDSCNWTWCFEKIDWDDSPAGGCAVGHYEDDGPTFHEDDDESSFRTSVTHSD